MNRTYKTEAIVLARRNIGEADKLLTLFTKHYGKRIVIAKGVRRIKSRRAAHLELFSQVKIVAYRGRTFDIITEACAIEQFGFIRERLERIGFVYIALELINRLTAENQESTTIFRQLLDYLHRFNDKTLTRVQANKDLFSFKLQLLSELGFVRPQPVLNEAAVDKTIEYIIERKLASPKMLTNIQRGL